MKIIIIFEYNYQKQIVVYDEWNNLFEWSSCDH